MKQKIGIFNCQGILTSAAKQQMLVNDFDLYKMSALAIQETKNELDVKLRSLPNIGDNKWKDITQTINDTTLTVLGKKPKHRFHVNDKMARLSKQE